MKLFRTGFHAAFVGCLFVSVGVSQTIKTYQLSAAQHDQQVSVYLENVPTAAHWGASIHSIDGNSVEARPVYVRELTSELLAGGNGSQNELLEDPTNNFSIEGDEMHLKSGPPGVGTSIDLGVPQGTHIKVYVNKELAYMGTGGEEVLLIDGQTLIARGGAARVRLLLSTPQTIVNEIGPDIKPGTNYEASNAGLRRHLIHPPQMPSADGMDDSFFIGPAQHRMQMASLRITISSTGTVISVQSVRGPKNLLNKATNSVMSAKFKPFLLNGEPSTVTGTVTYGYSHGAIHSSLDR